MQPTKNCTYVVQAWEGVKDGNPATINLDPYIDPVGIATIGYGHAIPDPDTGKFLSGRNGLRKATLLYPTGITKEQAIQLLAADIKNASVHLASPFLRPNTNQGEFDALVSFSFNVGIGNLNRSSLRRLHNLQAPLVDFPSDGDIFKLCSLVANRTLKPSNLLESFVAYSFARGAFLLGLFCRRISEYSLYAGFDGVSAVQTGANARVAIQKHYKKRHTL